MLTRCSCLYSTTTPQMMVIYRMTLTQVTTSLSRVWEDTPQPPPVVVLVRVVQVCPEPIVMLLPRISVDSQHLGASSLPDRNDPPLHKNLTSTNPTRGLSSKVASKVASQLPLKHVPKRDSLRLVNRPNQSPSNVPSLLPRPISSLPLRHHLLRGCAFVIRQCVWSI